MSMLHTSFAWWFQILCFLFTPSWGDNLIWLLFFQMGWNHQLVMFSAKQKSSSEQREPVCQGRLLAQLTDFGLAQQLPEGQTFIKPLGSAFVLKVENHVKGFWMFFGRFFLKWLGCMGCFGHQINPLVYLVNGVRPSLRRALVRIFHQPLLVVQPWLYVKTGLLAIGIGWLKSTRKESHSHMVIITNPSQIILINMEFQVTLMKTYPWPIHGTGRFTYINRWCLWFHVGKCTSPMDGSWRIIPVSKWLVTPIS